MNINTEFLLFNERKFHFFVWRRKPPIVFVDATLDSSEVDELDKPEIHFKSIT